MKDRIGLDKRNWTFQWIAKFQEFLKKILKETFFSKTKWPYIKLDVLVKLYFMSLSNWLKTQGKRNQINFLTESKYQM